MGKKEIVAREAADAAALAEAAQQKIEEDREAELSPQQHQTFAVSALCVATLVCFYFVDRYRMRTPYDACALALAWIASAVSLSFTYRLQATAAIARARSRVSRVSSEALRTACALEGFYYSLFVVNFWFLGLVASFAVVVVPQFVELHEKVPTSSAVSMVSAWKHLLGSTLAPAVLVWATARGLL